MANTDSTQQNYGRYKQGGTTQKIGTNIGWWQRKIFPTAVDDMVFELPMKYQHSPDLLAYDIYGTDLLGWFVLQYNNIINVNTEFVQGVRIQLPTKARLMSQLFTK
jgi:hypothetical protein